MRSLAIITATAATTVSFMPKTNGHTIVKQPEAVFKKGTKYPSQWAAEFTPPWSGTFRTGAQYAAAAKEKGLKTLRSFLEDKGPDCGYTTKDTTPKPIPSDGLVKFSRVLGHPGPCEVWLGEKLAFHNDDCMANLNTPGSVKVDYSLCNDSCLLRFYWLGLQSGGTRWQSYKNCVPLGSGKVSSDEAKDKPDSDSEPETSGNEADAEQPTGAGNNSARVKCRASKT